MTAPGHEVEGLLAGRGALLRDACARAVTYLDGLAGRRAAPAADEVAALRRLDFALPGPGMDAAVVLAMLGRDGLAGLVDRTCLLAQRFADGMRAAGHTVLNEVVLNQVVVEFGDTARTGAIIAAVADDGTCWCGPTTWRGRAAMRFSVSSWCTTEGDIDRSIAAVATCA